MASTTKATKDDSEKEPEPKAAPAATAKAVPDVVKVCDDLSLIDAKSDALGRISGLDPNRIYRLIAMPSTAVKVTSGGSVEFNGFHRRIIILTHDEPTTAKG